MVAMVVPLGAKADREGQEHPRQPFQNARTAWLFPCSCRFEVYLSISVNPIDGWECVPWAKPAIKKPPLQVNIRSLWGEISVCIRPPGAI